MQTIHTQKNIIKTSLAMEKTSCFCLNDWNYEELEILKTYYPREGAYVCKRLKEKSPISCIEIAKYLKLKMNGTRIPSVSASSEDTQEDSSIAYWTQEEIKILEEYYPKEGKYVAYRLSNRTFDACRLKAGKMNITYNQAEKECKNREKKCPWTEEEIESLISCDINNTEKLLEMFPNRTLNACREKYYDVYNERYGTWSQRERLILTEFYPIEGIEVAKRFKNKTPDACLYEADRLGLKCKTEWTEEEIGILTLYYPVEGANVAERLKNRSVKSCRKKAEKLGLKKKKKAELFI